MKELAVRSVPVRALGADDVAAVVAVHLRAFPSFFLSFLGPRFLREFYSSFLVDPMGRGFVAVDESGRMLGVVVGPLNPAGYFKRLLKRRWWAFCLASVSAVLRRPTVAPRLFRAVVYRGEAPDGPVRALLSSIAVDPQVQGGGVGRLLVERWVAEVRAAGGTGCFLTTDAEGNEAVNAFYRKLGWKLEGSYCTTEGRRMNRYVFDF
jgi:ribosomal protein S18 acetylase RimI-like enzyme